MSTANKILMGASGAGGPVGPSDDEFNLVSFLSHFDGSNDGVNNQFTDGSTSNHTITANGDVTQGSFGPFARPDGEWSVDFDGSDYLDANDGVTFGTGAFTIEFFVYLKANTQQFFFDARPNAVNTTYPVIYMLSNRTLVYYANSSARITSSTSEKLSEYTWHHIAVCRSGTSTKMFLDGTQVGSTYSDSTNYSDSGRMRIGANKNEGNDLDGYMSNVRVVNSALYTSNFTPPTAALTAITDTKLLTCQSNRFVDNSASGLTITPAGDPAVTAFGPFLPSSVYSAGTNGASAYFDDVDDYLSIADNTDFDLNGESAFTIEAWLWPSSESGTANDKFTIVSKRSGANGYLLLMTGANVLQFYAGSFLAASSLSVGAWHHVAVVKISTSSFKIYVNGVEEYTTSSNINPVDVSTALTIGADEDPAREYHGYMSDVRIVKGTAVYTSAFTPPTAPLTNITNTKLLLNMADGQAIDSAAQNNLTLAGNANTSTDQAKFGTTSLHLDGTGDYAEVASSIGAWGTGNFTVEGWYYLTAQAQYDNLFDFRTSSNTSHLDVYFDDDPLRLHVFFGDADRINANAATPTNEWVHIAVVRNGSTTTLYQNGTSLGTSTTVTTFTDGALRIGNRYSGDYYMQGYVDDFRISHMARYTSNFTAPTAAFPDKGQDA